MTQASVLDLSAVRSKPAPAKQYSLSEMRSAVHEIKRELRGVVVTRFKAIQSLLESAASPTARIQLAPGQPNPIQEKEMEVQYYTAQMNRLRDALGAAALIERLETNPSLGQGFDEILKNKNGVMGQIVDLLKTDIRTVDPKKAFVMASFKELSGAIDLLTA